MGKKMISFSRGPGGEPVDVSDDGLTTTYADGSQLVRPEPGAAVTPPEPNAVSFSRGPGGERVHVSDDGKTTTYSDGSRTIRP
ncbi:hypothetical protein [Actinomadura sp. NPDC049753]|uniref:hypothetical protein n=1 Tax=Actinomadura sp. NPDC049753 TaxID=3154739 RepID=UPI003422C90A